MAIDIVNFLLSLGTAMAAAVAPSSLGVTVGANLFVLEVPEAFAAATHAGLRVYGGPEPEERFRIDNISLQLAAKSKKIVPATRLAWQLYESLHAVDFSEESKPRYDWDVPGKKFNDAGTAIVDDVSTNWKICLIVLAAPPGHVGVDDRGMQQVSFNFNARFAPVPVS